MKIFQKYFFSKNLKERILIIAIVLSVILVLFPPFEVKNTLVKIPAKNKHALLLVGPDYCSIGNRYYSKYYVCNIAFQYLILELAAIWLVSGLVYVIKKEK